MINPRGFVLFTYGFRPFFLLAGWYGALILGVWLWLLNAGSSPLPALPASLWHGHEMIFGFISAAIAGFMLTAVPSWTGRGGHSGLPLALLTMLWVLGRIAFAGASMIPLPLLACIELAFLPGLGVLVGPALLRARNRNTPLLLVLLMLWALDAAFLLGVGRADPVLARWALVTALNVILLLLTVIAGRIVPAFTANALRQRGIEADFSRNKPIELLVVTAMAALVLIDAVYPRPLPAAAIALLAGLAHAIRLARWHGLRTLRDPIVWVLHAAYAWLPLGLLLKALHLVGAFPWSAFWLHALGAGAAGTMILAVMSRASLGHTGRPLVVSKAMAWAYVLLILAVMVRVFGLALLPLDYRMTLIVAGGLWCGAFLVFSWGYTPILVRPRADGKPG